MKIVIAGNWHSELHEEPVFNAFKELGHNPIRFQWHTYFKPQGLTGNIFRPVMKAQFKYMVGPIVAQVNKDLIALIAREKPDIVFIYRGILIYKETLLAIKNDAPNAILIGYNNDDPFSPMYPRWKWRHFLSGVPHYDLVLAYRLRNLDEYRAAGAKRVELLRSWFIPTRNYPMTLTTEEKNQFECDVVFVGHYENDGRLSCLEEIVKKGWKLRIFGPGYEWDSVLKRSVVLKEHGPVNLVWGEDYNKALSGARVALCFFSKLNRDTYTRRCFEIPASKTVLLAEHSDDLLNLFTENEEAVFFRNIPEMTERLDWLLSDDSRRNAIASAGYMRVFNDGHDIVSRMKTVLSISYEVTSGSI